MKYCSRCGAQADDDVAFCASCGAAFPAPSKPKTRSALQTAAAVFMVIGCVTYGWSLLPLAWLIPMTVVYFRRTREGGNVGLGFKICTLLFVNLIAGILMLCDGEDIS